MGIIDETKAGLREASAAVRLTASEQHDLYVDEIMEKLTDVIQQPVFVGDPQTALVHFLGREAFDDQVTTDRYTNLADEINDHRGETKVVLKVGGLDTVPVMVIQPECEGFDDYTVPASTTLVMANTSADEGVRFISKKERKEDVMMHVLTNTKAGVTERELSLVGNTARFRANITHYSKRMHLGAIDTSQDFTLAEDSEADNGHGKGMPSSYGFSDRSSELFESEPTILVGWESIDKTLARSIRGSALSGFVHALVIADLLEENGVYDLNTVLDNLPTIKETVLTARNLQMHIGSLAVTD